MRGPYPPSFGEYGDAETLTLNVFDLASELPSAILARIVSALACSRSLSTPLASS